MRGGIDVARAVDLGALKDKAKHAHRWVYVANFAIDDKTMASISEQRLRALRRQEKGLDPAEGAKHIPLPLTSENVIATDGPGCLKCSIHWTAPEGWGRLCPVSDDTYDAAGSPAATRPAHASVDVAAFPDEPNDTRAAVGGVHDEPGKHVVLDERGNVVRELPNT